MLALAIFTLATENMLCQTYQDVCNKGTWSNCGVAIKKALDKKPSDPKTILQIAQSWAKSYDTQFNALRKQGRIEKSTPDSEKIFEAVKSQLDPIEISKDQVVDDLVKKYLPKAAPVLKFASGPIGAALGAFFNSSEIATDYDELRLMNDQIQQAVLALLQPSLDSDWQSSLQQAVKNAVPQLKP
jgi:hypothetical protein